MLEYINSNGDIYTEEEIQSTANKKGVSFEEIVKRNGLQLNSKPKKTTPGAKKQTVVNQKEATLPQKNMASKSVPTSSVSKKNVWDDMTFDPTKEIIKQSGRNVAPPKKKAVATKPVPQQKQKVEPQYIVPEDLFDDEENVSKNIANKLAKFGLAPEETTGEGDFGLPRFNAITIRGARKNMLGTRLSREGEVEADLPAVKVGKDLSKAELEANAKILNDYIKAHGNLNFLEESKTKYAETLRKADIKAAPKSRTFEEKLKVYNSDLIKEFETKERNRKETMEQETPFAGTRQIGAVNLTEKDFDDQNKYKAYKFWKQGLPIPMPSTEKLEGHIKKVNNAYRDYEFSRFASDLDPEARVALTALNVERQEKAIDSMQKAKKQNDELSKKIALHNAKYEELLKTKPTPDALNAFKQESIALGNEITSFNENISRGNREWPLIQAGLKATKADYSRINQTLTALKSTAVDVAYGVADMATTVQSAKSAAMSAVLGEDFVKTYKTSKTALKPLLLDPIYEAKKGLETEAESYQQSISIDQVKDMKDFGRWGAQVFTSMPSSAAMALTGELALPMFFTSGYGSKKYELEADQERSLSRLQYNLKNIEDGLVSAEQMEDVQKEIKEDRRVLNISEGAKLTSALIAGTAEIAFEKLGTLKILKETNRVLDLIPPMEIKSALGQFGKEFAKSIPIEGATEGLTNLANNFGDVYILGEDKNLMDGVLNDAASGALMGPAFSVMGGANNITNALASEMRSRSEMKARAEKIKELRKITGLNDLPSNITTADISKLQLNPEIEKIVTEVVGQIENEDAEVLARFGKDLSIDQLQELGGLNQKARRIKKEFDAAMQNPTLSDSEIKTLRDYYQKQYEDVLTSREAILGDETKRKENNKEYNRKNVELSASEGWALSTARLTQKVLLDTYKEFDSLSNSQKQEYYKQVTNETDPAKIKEVGRNLYVEQKVGQRVKTDVSKAQKFAEDIGLDVQFTIAEGPDATTKILDAAKVLYGETSKEYKAFEKGIKDGSVNGVYQNGQVLIHLPNATKNGAISVGSHEVLHGLAENGFKINEDKANEAGLSLLEYLKSEQPDLYASVEERMKAYTNEDGTPAISNYGEEVMNALSDAFKDGSVPKENVLTKLSNWLNTITGGKYGQPSSTLNTLTMDSTDGSNVFNIIKDYNLATSGKAKKTKPTRLLVTKPEDEEKDQRGLTLSKSNKVTVYHGGQLEGYGSGRDLYVTANKRQAGFYAKGNQGDLFSFDIDKDKIATEDVAREVINDLGLQSPSKEYSTDELKLHELIDPRFKESVLKKSDIQKLYTELKNKGFDAVSFEDEDLEGGNRGIENIVVFGAKPNIKETIVKQNRADELFAQGYKPVIDGKIQRDFTQEQLDNYFESNEDIAMTNALNEEAPSNVKFSKSNLQGLFEKYGKNKTKFINESLSKTPGGKFTYDLAKSELGVELGGIVESITRRLYDGIPEDSKRMVTRAEYKDALIANAATLISKEYDPAKQGLDAFISSRLNLRANKLASELGIEGAEEGGFKLDVDEAKGIVAEEAPVQVKEAPKYKTILESKTFKPEVVESVTKKLLTTVRTLKSKINEPISINRTISPFIAEIKDAMGKQADIDIKKEMGGKANDQFKNFLLKNKKTILENMTTAWLSGKDVKGKVEGGIPEAVQKQIDGKWVSYPDWAGKKIDRETVNTDLAGRTSGNEITRRLPNAANNVSDEALLSRFIEPTGDLIRGRKESLSKAMAEELSFDILKENVLNEGELYDALVANQERLGVELDAITFEEIARQADRGNIKFSLSPNMIINISALLTEGYDGSQPIANVIKANKESDQWERYIDKLLTVKSTKERDSRIKDLKNLEKLLTKIESIAGLSKIRTKQSNNKLSAKHESMVRNTIKKILPPGFKLIDEKGLSNRGAASPDVHFSKKIGRGKNASSVDVFIEAKKDTSAQFASNTINVNSNGDISLIGIDGLIDDIKKIFLDVQSKINNNSATKSYFNKANMIGRGTWEIPIVDYYKMQYSKEQSAATVEVEVPVSTIAAMYAKKNNGLGTDLLVIGESVFTFNKAISAKSGIPMIIGSQEMMDEVKEYNQANPDNKINFVPGIATAIMAGRVMKAAGQHPKHNSGSTENTHIRYNYRVIPVLTTETKRELNKFIKSNPDNVKITDDSFKSKLDAVAKNSEFKQALANGEKINKSKNNYLAATKFSLSNINKGEVKKIRVFDFDDTLARTKSNIWYTMPDGTEGKLNAVEFAKNGDALLAQGATFDFKEFSKVMEGKKGPLFEVAKYISKNTEGDMFVLTARPADSKFAIHEFLTGLGLNIPLDNIVGLGNSAAEAKADWMVSKVAEGYNDFYFADDHLANVSAVKAALNQFDVKSKTQQAKVKFSRSLNSTFNKMLENKKGVPSRKKFSDIQARRAGKGKNRFNIFMPSSAEDFSGLLYSFLNKGEQGEADMKFFEDALITPYTDAVAAMEVSKQAMKRDFNSLKKLFPDVTAKLGKKIPGMDFTYDQAIRVNMWTRDGYDIPGLSKSEIRSLNSVINKDKDLTDFANALNVLGNREQGWKPPKDYWEVDTIVSELNNMTEKEGRKEYLQEFIANAQEIFSDENLNKIEAIYGAGFRSALEDSLYRMENGTNRNAGNSKIVNSWLNWVNNSTGAIMFLNTKSVLLQTIGAVNFINWSDNNPYRAAKAFANQKQYWQDFATLWNSDKLKERRQGLKEDVAAAEIANAASGASNKPKAAFAYLLKIGFTPTQIADSFAICSGGATFYRNRIETYKNEYEGLDSSGNLKRKYTDAEAEAKAFQDFARTSDQSQQSADPMLISQEQGTVLGRLILAFGNTSMQYNRLMKKAILDLANGRGDAKTHISKILYYGAVQNIVFSALQNGLMFVLFGGDEDEEEKQKAREKDISKKSIDALDNTLDSLLRGAGLAGATVSTIKNIVQEYYKQTEKGPGKEDSAEILLAAASISPPMSSKLRKLNSAYKTMKFDKDIIEQQGWSVTADGKLNLSSSYSVLGNVVSATTNVPLDRAVSKVNNMAEAFDSRNTAWQRIASALGWNAYSIGVKNEEFDLIQAKAKEVRKEESIEKAYEKREALKDSIRSLRGLERRNYLMLEREKKREEARRRKERKLRRRMGE